MKHKRIMRVCIFILFGMAGSSWAGVDTQGPTVAPSLFWIVPFAALLLAIGLCPLIPHVSGFWEHNRNKLLASVALAVVACLYYLCRGYGYDGSEKGWPALLAMLQHGVVGDYIPFIILLFSLYTISGGISLTGDIPAHPVTNTIFLLAGSVLASLIGTTGASMLLVRPLLQINSERRHTKHTFIFFIFLVSNIGGALLPLGDPPLFLGYLRGVPFFWTLRLFPMWAVATGILLAIYYVFDMLAYRRESLLDVRLDEARVIALKLSGKRNFVLLAGVIVAVALLVPGRMPPSWHLRDIVLLALAGVSLWITPKQIHLDNQFNFNAIAEVACLFIGIFITMQAPIEILKAKGDALGVTSSLQYFWASGALSSFLDNAPTYVVFFELAGALHLPHVEVLNGVMTATGHIALIHLAAISCGAVFMGANTYIGNGPNFLVKSIAEEQGVRMPGFFGYMLYSGVILIPTFILISVLFFI